MTCTCAAVLVNSAIHENGCPEDDSASLPVIARWAGIRAAKVINATHKRTEISVVWAGAYGDVRNGTVRSVPNAPIIGSHEMYRLAEGLDITALEATYTLSISAMINGKRYEGRVYVTRKFNALQSWQRVSVDWSWGRDEITDAAGKILRDFGIEAWAQLEMDLDEGGSALQQNARDRRIHAFFARRHLAGFKAAVAERQRFLEALQTAADVALETLAD